MLLNCGIGEDSWEYLGLQEIKPVNPQRNQSWIFIGRTDGEAETPIICPPDMKSWLIWKDPDAGKDWKEEEKGTTEDGITDTMDMGLSKLWELVMDRKVWHAVVHVVAKSQTRLSKWTELIYKKALIRASQEKLLGRRECNGTQKILNVKTVSQKYSIQQRYPSYMEEK